MKKIFPLAFTLFMLSFVNVKAQNTYDTYFNNIVCPYAALDPLSSDPIIGDVLVGYTGEYQIFLEKYPASGVGGHPWVYSSALNSNTITYKIEAVSFPFTPNCFSCQTFFPSTPFRILRMPDDQFPYVGTQKAWIRNTSSLPPATGVSFTNNYLLRREFSGIYDDPISPFVEDNTHYSTLASQGIPKFGDEFHDDRVFYPHTILKHTFYMHCGDETQPIVDSFSFVLDHTRGRMSYYPFKGTNTSTGESEHDVAIFPTWYPQTSATSLNTIEYFPMLQTPSNCQTHIPPSGGLLEDYIRPEPGTVLQVLLGSHMGQGAAGTLPDHSPQPGIPHQYVIDRSFDLNILNPSEKIIYNPSDVAIDLNQPYNTTPESKILTFPSGYTFKTVNGIYPTVAQVEAGDPQNLYHHPQDIISENTLNVLCDEVGANDGYFSYYRVKSGSTLVIEPCVRLFDVKIIVETGAELFYNSVELDGRHYEIVSTGGIIHNAFTPILSYANCPFNCYNNAKFDIVGDYEITTNKTWTPSNILTELDASLDGRIEIGGTIIIRSGNTLTINGAVKLAFGETGKIVIEPNAKLIVNAVAGSEAVFTNIEFCEKSMWEGIQVIGDGVTFQGPSPISLTTQGFLHLNNVLIENARTAIKMGDGNVATNDAGGVVNAVSATFRNNYVDAEFIPFVNLNTFTSTVLNYTSAFVNCKFETTRKLNDPYYVAAGGRPIGGDKHIILNDVKRVRISNCTFENSATSMGLPLFDADLRGTGIYGIDAEIHLQEGTISNTFKNLSVGVHAISTGTPRYVDVVGNHFLENVHGLVLEGTNLSQINLNDFTIPASSNNSILINNTSIRGYNKPVGLYLVGATNYTAEENTFSNYGTTSPGASSDSYNYGIVANNCSGSPLGAPKTGGGIGYLYKNSFNNLNVNLQTELDNKGGAGTGSGLYYGCNEFNTRVDKDVTVVGNATISELGFLRDQGLCGLPEEQAGNNYSAGCGMPYEELWFDSDIINAYGLSMYSDFYYSDQPFKFSCTNFPNPSSDNGCFSTGAPNPCLSNLVSCLTIPCLTTIDNDAQIALSTILISYKEIIDGGNTGFLLNQINSSISAGQLKNLLLSKSPYLSDVVLLATINRSNPLPPGHLKQIIIANSPVTALVLEEVQNSGLPSGILNNILSAQTGISARNEKERELDYYMYQAKLARVKLKQAYLQIDVNDSVCLLYTSPSPRD